MNETFKRRVCELMDKNNINQKGLAAEIGITQSSLSRNINGVHRPKAEVVEAIAKYFGVTTDYLIGNSDDAKPQHIQNIEAAFFDEFKGMSPEDKQRILKKVVDGLTNK